MGTKKIKIQDQDLTILDGRLTKFSLHSYIIVLHNNPMPEN